MYLQKTSGMLSCLCTFAFICSFFFRKGIKKRGHQVLLILTYDDVYFNRLNWQVKCLISSAAHVISKPRVIVFLRS